MSSDGTESEHASAIAAAFAAFESTSDDCLGIDRRKIRKRLVSLRRRWQSHDVPAAVIARKLEDIGQAIARSRAIRQSRAALDARIDFPTQLPFSAHAEAIAARLASHQVVVVSGETGCGKSTQLPKLCLRLGRGIVGRIGHTQPRRIAARAVARRIAEETDTRPGQLVGHCIRFDDDVLPCTRIKVMTDGILLNEIHRDPWLNQYDTLIIDEVHERSLNIDFLLGYLKNLIARRPDLKLIITSATLEVRLLTDFFAGAASYAIPGRSYPVELRYRPLAEEGESELDMNEAILTAVGELDSEAPGDILVFLPGERHIRDAALYLSRAPLDRTEIVSLFGRMNGERQAKVFAPGNLRRIILATNVAETSLTVPRVRHVIDTGLARISRYSPRRKLQQLPVEKIAQANADQRKGRCGRESAGICVRLYSEADFNARHRHHQPEIQRTNLAGVILRLKAQGVADVEKFPFIEAPAVKLIKDGYAVLHEIGALDGARQLTALGRSLVRFPVDPRLARILLAASTLGCLAECRVIVAALSIVDPRERPYELREAADRAHAQFEDRRSDFMWFLRAWPFAREVQQWSGKQQARQCRRHFLSAARLREWTQLHDYLERLTQAEGMVCNAEAASYKAIHTALAAGFPSQIGGWQGEYYLGCRNANFRAHPSSVLARQAPRWALAAELIETDKRYARVMARIEPQWLERAADHLIQRTYETPRWDVRRGCARVLEIQRLFGLIINAQREVDFVRIDRAGARALFIEAAMVDGNLGEDVEFLTSNQALLAHLHELEVRARRRDLVLTRAQLQSFYDERIPVDIASRRDLLAWLRRVPEASALLTMGDLEASGGMHPAVLPYLFPDALQISGTDCPLTYRFAPGDPQDGVTLCVPLVLLSRLSVSPLDRLVPGLLSAKVEAMLRALPKSYRRLVSPLRDFAMACVEALAAEEGALPAVLAEALSRMTGVDIPAALFEAADLPPHLHFNIELVNADGAVCGHGRDLLALRRQFASVAETARRQIDWGLSGRSAERWSFSALPSALSVAIAGMTLHGYPVLVDCGDAVEIQIVDDPITAADIHSRGIARMLLQGAHREQRHLVRLASDLRGFSLLAARFGHAGSPVPAVMLAAALRWAKAANPRDATVFAGLAQQFDTAVVAATTDSIHQLNHLFRRGASVYAELDRLAVPQVSDADLRSQVMNLLGPAVIETVERGQAGRLGRYFDAIARRLQRLEANPGKDLKKLDQLAPLWQRYLAQIEYSHEASQRLRELHFLFEDYRVALFAPELGSASAISYARIERELAGVAGK